MDPFLLMGMLRSGLPLPTDSFVMRTFKWLVPEARSYCLRRFHAKQHTSIDIHADAQIGGPLVIQAVRGRQELPVPLADKASAALCFQALPKCTQPPNCAGPGFQIHRKKHLEGSEVQRAPDAWLQVLQTELVITLLLIVPCFL